MKIKGWEKISGYTYKGYSIVNPIHNADETMYEATILNLNSAHYSKWELNVLTPAHKWKNDNDFSIIVRDEENRSTVNSVGKQRMASIAIFRQIFEEMVDKILGMQLTSAAVTPNSHSMYYNRPINPNNYGIAAAVVTGTGGGLMSTINSNGNTTTWNPNTNLPKSMLIAIKELQEQIDNLKQKNNVNN